MNQNENYEKTSLIYLYKENKELQLNNDVHLRGGGHLRPTSYIVLMFNKTYGKTFKNF